jgi:hypothetical protein
MQYVGVYVNKKYNMLINYFDCISTNEFLNSRIYHVLGFRWFILIVLTDT